MGGGQAKRSARQAAQQAQDAQNIIMEQAAKLKTKEAMDRERAQRLMVRSLRGGAGGFYGLPANEPVLGESSGVLG